MPKGSCRAYARLRDSKMQKYLYLQGFYVKTKSLHRASSVPLPLGKGGFSARQTIICTNVRGHRRGGYQPPVCFVRFFGGRIISSPTIVSIGTTHRSFPTIYSPFTNRFIDTPYNQLCFYATSPTFYTYIAIIDAFMYNKIKLQKLYYKNIRRF